MICIIFINLQFVRCRSGNFMMYKYVHAATNKLREIHNCNVVKSSAVYLRTVMNIAYFLVLRLSSQQTEYIR